jgi:hypothetical protein
MLLLWPTVLTEGRLTLGSRAGANGCDDDGAVLDPALAVLATAILVVRYVVRKRDVIHGRFIEEKISDDDGCTSQYRRRMSPGSLTGFGGLTNGQYAAGRTVANAPASRAIWSRDLGASRDEQ